MRRLRYVARTLLLPGPGGSHTYLFKLLHDTVALPLWIGYRRALAYLNR
jgi:hypothetical protein